MSKSDGLKIGIRFTEDLIGNIDGLNPPIGYVMGTNDLAQGKTVTVGNASYGAGANAVDGNASTYWGTYSTLPWWISVDLGEIKKSAGFYILQSNASYRAKDYVVLGSNDGTNFTQISTGQLENIAEQTIPYNASDYQYIRINFTSYWSSSRAYIYTIKILEAIPAGNELAFTITGKEYQYVNGNLIDKEYQVDKVERYPTQRLWGIDESIILEGEGWQEPFNDMNSWDIQYGGNKWNIVDFEGENVLRHYSTAQTRDVLRATNLGILMDADIYCDVYITGTGTSGKRPSIATRIGGTAGSETFYTFPARARDNKIQIGKYVSGTFTELAYSSFNYKANTWYTIRASTEGNNLKFKIWERGQVEPSSWNLETTDNSISSGYVGLFDFDGNRNSYFDNFELKGEYLTPKIYTTDAIELSRSVIVSYVEIKPQNTDIIIEYTTGETQGQWQEVDNGEVINIDTNLWIRVTLSTEDETVTPILEDLWLEEPDAPRDKILITLDWWNRFNNVEDKIKVLYDASKGSLTGAGGAVESFEIEFTPEDLIQTPNPNAEELIKAYPYEIVADLKEVDIVNVTPEETIKAYPYEIVLNLINVDEINP